MLVRDFDGAETFQMCGDELRIQQNEPPAAQMMHKSGEADL